MKKIFIVILHYNGYDDIEKCLKTLPRLTSPKYSLHTIVVDNGSRIEEQNKLKKFLKATTLQNVILIENKKNFGFAKGNNVGIKEALKQGADYILLLNNDTKIEDNFLPNLLKLNAEISSPVLKFREFIDKPTYLYDHGGYVNWWTGRTTHLNAYKEDLKIYLKNDSIDVDYVSGCCLLAKKEVYEKIGLLDEKYFFYFEDVDFCVSAKKLNMRVVVDPKTVVYHRLGGSMDRWSNRAIYRNLEGNFIFITKHLGIRRIIAYGYLSLLTLKILRDRFFDMIKSKLTGTRFLQDKKKSKGAKHYAS